jgi:hypothetical protein
MWNALVTRWEYVKVIGKSWWALVVVAYGSFWGLDAAMEKWNPFDLKAAWDANTTHLPSR